MHEWDGTIGLSGCPSLCSFIWPKASEMIFLGLTLTCTSVFQNTETKIFLGSAILAGEISEHTPDSSPYFKFQEFWWVLEISHQTENALFGCNFLFNAVKTVLEQDNDLQIYLLEWLLEGKTLALLFLTLDATWWYKLRSTRSVFFSKITLVSIFLNHYLVSVLF